MKNKTHPSLYSIISCLLLVCFSTVSYAKTSIWVAKKDDKQIILAGIVQLVPSNGYAWPIEYLDILIDAKRVVFETEVVPKDIRKAADLVDSTFNQLKLPEGETLQTQLSMENWQLLNDYAAHHLQEVTPYKAIIASSVLLTYDRYQRGFVVNSSVELYQLAKRQRKEILALETREQRFRQLVDDSTFNANLLVEILIYQLAESRKDLEAKILATYTADVDFFNHWADPLSTNAKILYKQQLANRNLRWVEKIDQLAQLDTPTVVFVSIEYLVEDQVGLLNKLQEKGYEIHFYERNQP